MDEVKLKTNIIQTILMVKMSHKLILRAKSKSKARILRKQVKSYILGQEYEVTYEITNIGNNPFSGGAFSVEIAWPNGQHVFTPYLIPSLDPGATFSTGESVTGALSSGYALFFVRNVSANDKKEVELYNSPGNPLDPRVSFYSVFAKTPEEIYEFWAMLIAAFSLLIIMLEKIIPFLLWLYSIFPKG